MSGSQQLILGTGAGGVVANYIEDVFSTWLYTGNGSTQTITNGIDLSTKGGLLWIKNRDTLTYNHILSDTTQPVSKFLYSNSTSALDTDSSYITARGTSGFTVGSGNPTNYSGINFVSWTFRKQPKFFDVVTYTGDGAATKTISHNLGSTPGFVIIKNIDQTGNWMCWHNSFAATDYIALNTTGAKNYAGALTDIYKGVSSTTVTIGSNAVVNNSGYNYVMYVFAHDAGGFGLTGTDNVISCGSYTGNGSSTGPSISLGYEPQWIMIKRAVGGTSAWNMYDTMRGMPLPTSPTFVLQANSSGVEYTGPNNFLAPTATGFSITSTSSDVNTNGDTYIYIAIRRGPMKTPTTGTSVFDPVLLVDGVTNLPPVNSTINAPDLAWSFARNAVYGYGSLPRDRLSSAGISFLQTASTAAETSYAGNTYGFTRLQKGIDGANAGSTFNQGSPGTIYWMFGRAPGFFDVVCYTGNDVSARAVNHNLGVAPELVIVKARNDTANWPVYASALGNNKTLYVNLTDASATSGIWGNTTATSSYFYVGVAGDYGINNATGLNYVAYLFASCPGVSKVGSYTGTGTTLQVNCGFTGGARFVLIKRTDSTGDWYVWDSTRGMVAGNDPYLLLNSATAEVTNTDYVDTYSAGFEISSTAPAAINANGGSFIFLAIA